LQPGFAVVIASTEQLAVGPTGAVAGPVWLIDPASGAEFPEQGWSDFSVALLAAWIPALRRLARRGETAECYFREGPYHFSVSARGERWRVSCFEDRQAETRVSNAVVEFESTAAAFLGSVLAASKALLGYCDARSWWNADTEELRRALESEAGEPAR